ncbi:MAG: hypothetical protein SXV54_13915 [Chloroflexota bacterium]|nr:hypothetical protein [Chloroflexota bacterium]
MLNGMRDVEYLMNEGNLVYEDLPVTAMLVIAKRIASLTEAFEAQNQLLERICVRLEEDAK